MPRGGRRSGKPGTAYASRSDMNAQPVRTAPGQTYGAATQQADAQRAVPLPASPPVQASPGPTVASSVPPDPGMLHAPSARPAEPVTAGLPIGAGAGPEALMHASPEQDALSDLKRMYVTNPSEPVRQIIERLEREVGLPL